MGKVSCQVCNRSCKGQAIRLNDKYYHLKCFKCNECKKPLATGGFYTKDDVHYCIEDYQRLFGVRCHSCQEFVEGEVVSALGNTYHEQCFHCTGCQRKFASGDKVTCVENDYLCTVCLKRIGADVDDEYDEQPPTVSLPFPRESVSAPTTPAKKDYSSTSSLDNGLTDGHLSSSTILQISTNSNYMDITSNDFKSQDSIDVPVFIESTPQLALTKRAGPSHRGRLSPIQTIMRYRSVSPWSTMSQSSPKSKDSGSVSGRSSRFDADYGKFYNSSYLDKYSNFRRGPSQNMVNVARDKSPRHYHRPENFSYMQGRQDIKSSKKGLLTMLGDRTYSDSLRQLERYRPDKALEPIQLSRFPDAKKHNCYVSYVAPIERDDWPAPPDPAAAYPELLRSRVGIRHKSSLSLPEQVNDNKENINGTGKFDDDLEANPKIVREMEELAKMKDSGAAKVILEDLKRRQHEKSVLDPRSSSRTPSAAMEPPYRPRYDSPLFASPSRDTDLRTCLRSVDSLIERKYRTAALLSVTASLKSCQIPKNLVRNPSVPRPGYTHSVKVANYNLKNFDGLEVTTPLRPVSSAGEFMRNIYSSLSSVNEVDPTTGLRRNPRARSYTVSEGTASPYCGYRRSVPSLFKVEEPIKIYSYEQLRKMFAENKLTPDIDKENIECHLSPIEFDSVFGMTADEFFRLAEWKRNDLKSRVGLF